MVPTIRVERMTRSWGPCAQRNGKCCAISQLRVGEGRDGGRRLRAPSCGVASRAGPHRPPSHRRSREGRSHACGACSAARWLSRGIHPARQRWRPRGAARTVASVRALPCRSLQPRRVRGPIADPITDCAGLTLLDGVRDQTEQEALAVRPPREPRLRVAGAGVRPDIWSKHSDTAATVGPMCRSSSTSRCPVHCQVSCSSRCVLPG